MTIQAISFADGRRGWALATRHEAGRPVSRLYSTSDGGSSWTELPGYRDPSGIYVGISLVDQKTGYVGSDSGPLLVTRDGGTTFTPVGTGASSRLIHFTNPETGWMVRGGKLLTTTNGGETWLQNPLPCSVLDLDLRPDKDGWVIVYDCPSHPNTALMSTVDGGQTWIRFDLPDVSPALLFFADRQHGWIVDATDRLFETKDAGHSIRQLPMGQ